MKRPDAELMKQVNNLGKRLKWARVQLDLVQKQVADGADIPRSTYCLREGGVRPQFFEEILILATFLDGLWRRKFADARVPLFEGRQVRFISSHWLMFGQDPEIEAREIRIQELEYLLEREGNYRKIKQSSTKNSTT